MKIEQGKSYLTKSGNTVKCLALVETKEKKTEAICAYTKIAADGHGSLMNVSQRWTPEGKWVQFPGGIHDIVKEA